MIVFLVVTLMIAALTEAVPTPSVKCSGQQSPSEATCNRFLKANRNTGWYYDRATNKCVKFTNDKGCRSATGSLFTLNPLCENACQKVCGAKIPDKQTCEDYLKKHHNIGWFYDSKTNNCIKITNAQDYKGCLTAKGSLFSTSAECLNDCKIVVHKP